MVGRGEKPLRRHLGEITKEGCLRTDLEAVVVFVLRKLYRGCRPYNFTIHSLESLKTACKTVGCGLFVLIQPGALPLLILPIERSICIHKVKTENDAEKHVCVQEWRKSRHSCHEGATVYVVFAVYMYLILQMEFLSSHNCKVCTRGKFTQRNLSPYQRQLKLLQ